MAATPEEVFSQILYEEMARIFTERGIDRITEEELDSIVKECLTKVYYPMMPRLMYELGRGPVLPRAGWSTGFSGINLRRTEQ